MVLQFPKRTPVSLGVPPNLLFLMYTVILKIFNSILIMKKILYP